MMSAIIELSGESGRRASGTARITDGKRGAVPSENRRHAEKMHVCATRRPCTGSGRPHQAQAAGVDRGFVIEGKAYGHESSDSGLMPADDSVPKSAQEWVALPGVVRYPGVGG